MNKKDRETLTKKKRMRITMSKSIIAESSINSQEEKGNGINRLDSRAHKTLPDIIDCDGLQTAQNQIRARARAGIIGV